MLKILYEWCPATEDLPKDGRTKSVLIEGHPNEAKYSKHHDMWINLSNDFFPSDQVEWLRPYTPTVEAPVKDAGVLVKALEWYADAGNYMSDNGKLATAWEFNDNMRNKAVEALTAYNSSLPNSKQ